MPRTTVNFGACLCFVREDPETSNVIFEAPEASHFLLVDVPPPPPDWFGHEDDMRLSSESKIQLDFKSW